MIILHEVTEISIVHYNIIRFGVGEVGVTHKYFAMISVNCCNFFHNIL
jgi:hypothetical protein